MDDKIIVKLKLMNGSLIKELVIYESGLVKDNNFDVKKIDVIEDIIEYLDNATQTELEKSSFDDKCEVEYKNRIYNSGTIYSNIELMIRNNCSLKEMNAKKIEIRVKEEQKKEEKIKKEKQIAENKAKVIDFYNNRIQLNIDTLKDESIREFESINFSLKKKDEFAIGESRVLSKYIDIADGLDYPKELEFLAQINLSDLSKFDNSGLLPKTGFLYFFQGPMIDDTYYECGKVIYSDEKNIVRKNAFIYNDDMVLELGIDNINIKRDIYSDENEKENKIFGIYSDPQLNENEILKVSNKYLVLLQLGWDIYDEGVISFLISREDLINKDFSKIIYTYSQT